MHRSAADDFYALIDSGQGEKLERFGEITLARPSAACVWTRRKPRQVWNSAQASYEPKTGWHFPGQGFETWKIDCRGSLFELRLQTNGQIGIFPEHAEYLPEVYSSVSSTSREYSKPVEVLNLFAYTGLASVYCAKRGARVCHVDLSKKALGWTEANLQLNSIETRQIRFICDDAIKFVTREIKRRNSYDLVILDPPSFSRTSKTAHWKLEDSVAQLISDCSELVLPRRGTLVFTCHDPAVRSNTLANLLYDCVGAEDGYAIRARELTLREQDSPRELPAGSIAYATSRTRV